jgi:ABC-type Fe3+-citrate transport system substrate-binding protein
VPSVTETLRALGVEPVACTRFCEQPDLRAVGGTKNPDLDAIVSLRPDLVVVNDEENRFEDAQALTAAGLRIHSMSPRSVAAVGPAMRAFCSELAVEVPAPFDEHTWDRWLDEQRAAAPSPRLTAAILVWRRPWMTLNAETYGSSLLELIGIDNAFSEAGDRYPELTLDELAAHRPSLVLLPDEPYVFRAKHAGEVAEAVPSARVELLEGRDLFWWGIRTLGACARLADVLRRR